MDCVRTLVNYTRKIRVNVHQNARTGYNLRHFQECSAGAVYVCVCTALFVCCWASTSVLVTLKLTVSFTRETVIFTGTSNCWWPCRYSAATHSHKISIWPFIKVVVVAVATTMCFLLLLFNTQRTITYWEFHMEWAVLCCLVMGLCARDKFRITWNIVHLQVHNLVCWVRNAHQSICIYREQLNLCASDAIKCPTKLPNNNFQNYRVHFPICCAISAKGVKTKHKVAKAQAKSQVDEQDTSVQLLILQP